MMQPGFCYRLLSKLFYLLSILTDRWFLSLLLAALLVFFSTGLLVRWNYTYRQGHYGSRIYTHCSYWGTGGVTSFDGPMDCPLILLTEPKEEQR
jgi:hypothetical protein